MIPAWFGCRGGRLGRLPDTVSDVNEFQLLIFRRALFDFDYFRKGFYQQRQFLVPVIAGVEVRHLLGEHPAHDAEEGPAAVVGGVFDRVCEQCLEIVVDRTDDRLGLCRIRSRGYLFLRSGGFCGGCLRSNVSIR